MTDEWQPIETAPADEVLLYLPAIPATKDWGVGSRAAVKVGRVSDYYGRRVPTHWMPLPKAPTQ